ncbi:MAG: hypothetical protein H7A35_09925 [Planctomycetales bacterium]|nr:hypothetical protein [bacterium]UNM07193.1 MAG: hypothetical protein H7A35_09925 [Planctomycetales bacterium]
MRNPFGTYLKHAFGNQYNYIAMALFGGLGVLLDPGWLMIGGGLELLYLWMMASNPRFMRHVDSLIEDEKALNYEALRDKLWAQIELEQRDNYRALEQQAVRISADELPRNLQDDPFFQENRRKVATLLANYLRMAVAVTRYNRYLDSADPQKITENIERLQSELGEASERVVGIKKKNIEVLQKRLDKLEKAKSNLEYLKAQMETIEDTMHLAVDQITTQSDPKGSSMQIDNLLFNLQETELIAQEMESVLELEDGLDESFNLPRERE